MYTVMCSVDSVHHEIERGVLRGISQRARNGNPSTLRPGFGFEPLCKELSNTSGGGLGRAHRTAPHHTTPRHATPRRTAPHHATSRHTAPHRQHDLSHPPASESARAGTDCPRAAAFELSDAERENRSQEHGAPHFGALFAGETAPEKFAGLEIQLLDLQGGNASTHSCSTTCEGRAIRLAASAQRREGRPRPPAPVD
jgi:hypothetical protein